MEKMPRLSTTSLWSAITTRFYIDWQVCLNLCIYVRDMFIAISDMISLFTLGSDNYLMILVKILNSGIVKAWKRQIA